MKGERRWTQGGIGKYARLAGARPPDETILMGPVLGSSLGFQAGGKTDSETDASDSHSQFQSPSVSPLSSARLTLRRTCAQNELKTRNKRP